jgi:spore germination protein KB
MGKEVISAKQGIGIGTIYIMGSSLVLGAGNEAEQNVWLAQLIALLAAVPTVCIYALILGKYPGKNLFEIIETVFPKIIAQILILLYVWYAFHLGALVIRNFTEFIHVISLPETPKCITALFMILMCIWAAKAGVETMGRWTLFTLPTVMLFIIIVTLLLTPQFHFENLKPFLNKGLSPVLDSAFSVFSFPFAELVIFLSVFCHLKEKSTKAIFKAFLWSLLIGGGVLILVSVRTLITLGVHNVSILYFASYASVRLISIGGFLERIEVTVSIVFLLGGFIKISICLYTACKGLARLFNMRDYRTITAPVGLLMMLLSDLVYDNITEMFEWAVKTYKYYALPFQVILPILILCAAKLKTLAKDKLEMKRT